MMPEENVTPKSTPAPAEAGQAVKPAPAPEVPVPQAPAAVPTVPVAPATPAAAAPAVAPAPAPAVAPAPVIAPVVVQPPAPVAPAAPVLGPDQPSEASKVSVADTISIAKEAAKEAAVETAAKVAATWFDGMELSDDQKGFMENKKFKSLGDMVTSHVNLEKFAGGSKKVVEIPTEESPEEVVSVFREKIGAPKAVEDIVLDLPEQVNEPVVEAFKKAVVENGVPITAAQKIATAVLEAEAGAVSQITEKHGEAAAQEIQELEKELGAAFAPTIEVAKKTMAKEEIAAIVPAEELETKLGPAKAVKLAAVIGKAMGEDVLEGASTGGDFVMTPDAAKAKEAELLADPTFKERYMKGEEAAVQQITKLKALQTGIKA